MNTGIMGGVLVNNATKFKVVPCMKHRKMYNDVHEFDMMLGGILNCPKCTISITREKYWDE